MTKDTHGSEATGEDEEYTTVGFGFVSSEFNVSAGGVSGKGAGVIGDATYEHKLDKETDYAFYIWPQGETRNASNTITILITPDELVNQSSLIELQLATGNWQYTYDASITGNILSTCPLLFQELSVHTDSALM